ncbi:hypothetical protein BAUCODRAFT_418846 [Baudoinia panamericana UAMH 10762]|uniref:Uncharacterized protein n=1 Tax=Baudoinia panamericana (strain UAMH 10762) TaxID=717646 RepID=M2NGX0_BAUPA|nr:uncharacterized protein BAUCODRAFT_418846 [Baudoinia panamericana UAMH 10762]EMC98260.1 hypothetical protein BAUCODRAFT_418846 [Baudoinia panamericana UAMH 10762]
MESDTESSDVITVRRRRKRSVREAQHNRSTAQRYGQGVPSKVGVRRVVRNGCGTQPPPMQNGCRRKVRQQSAVNAAAVRGGGGGGAAHKTSRTSSTKRRRTVYDQYQQLIDGAKAEVTATNGDRSARQLAAWGGSIGGEGAHTADQSKFAKRCKPEYDKSKQLIGLATAEARQGPRDWRTYSACSLDNCHDKAVYSQ